MSYIFNHIVFYFPIFFKPKTIRYTLGKKFIITPRKKCLEILSLGVIQMISSDFREFIQATSGKS